MNTYKYAKYVLASLSVFALGACNDDDTWEPGPADVVENQVYVTSAAVDGEIMPGETNTYKISFAREDSKGAASVPLELTGSEEFSAPKTVEFADGEQTASVEVKFTATDAVGKKTASLKVAEGKYSSPYTDKKTTVYFEILVAKWNMIATLTPQFTANSGVAEYHPSLVQLDDPNGKEGEELYRILGAFPGVDMTFTLTNTTYAGEPNADGTPRQPTYGRIVFKNGYNLNCDPFDWGYNAWSFFDQERIYDDDYVEAWITLPGLDNLRLWDPFIMDDTTYDYPVIYFTGSTPYIYFMLVYWAYDNDWNYNSTNNYDYVYFYLNK